MIDESGGWRRIGDHSFRVEPPDLLFVRDRGDILPEHAEEILQEARRLAESGGPPLWIIDMTELGEVPARTRRVAAHFDILALIGAVAVLGASFMHRITMKVVLNVAKLARPGAPTPEVRFFASEGEARAWLDEVRRGRSASP